MTRAHTEVELAHRLGLPTVAALNAALRARKVPPPDATMPHVGRVWYVPDDLREWLAGDAPRSQEQVLAERARSL